MNELCLDHQFRQWSGNHNDQIESLLAGTIRVGVDIQSIQRFRNMDADIADAVKNRSFTDAERTYCEASGDPNQHYAVRWAAKEAFMKALDGYVPLTAVAVECGDSRPQLMLSTHARTQLRETLGTDQWVTDVSLSHDRTADAAMAQVIFAGERNE